MSEIQSLDVMGHRTDAVDSQKLVGTITQASGHRVRLGTPPHLHLGPL